MLKICLYLKNAFFFNQNINEKLLKCKLYKTHVLYFKNDITQWNLKGIN